MFTPPPSPLPILKSNLDTHFPPPKSKPNPLMLTPDDNSMDILQRQQQSGFKSHANTPSSLQTTFPWTDPINKKSSRRRIFIPLFALALVLVAVISRSNSKLLFTSTSPSSTDGLSFKRPPPSHWIPFHHKHSHLRNRADLPLDVTPSPTTTTVSTSSAPAIPNPPFPVPTPFPQPFDTTFSYNFSTSSCQSFFGTSLLSNITFRQCRPFSLLLPASAEFFSAQSNLTLLTSIVGGTCNTTPTPDTCTSVMSWFGTEMRKDSVCGKDITDRNAVVLETLNGFTNYAFMRQAGCLVNPVSNTYCFVDAVSATSPSDFYFYTLPLGTPLPNNTTPSCSSCVQSLMAIYATEVQSLAAVTKKNATNSLYGGGILNTYQTAANKAIEICGAKYAVALNFSSLGFRSFDLSIGSAMWMVFFGFLSGVAVLVL